MKGKKIPLKDASADELDLSHDLVDLSNGIDSLDEGSDNDESTVTSVLKQDNSKKKKSGGFQSMGLSYPVLKGILKKGYKVPTPIQRKAIPVLMEGKDVVAMARTGSGKTGAFLIPMLERLKARTSKVGARALIFSPTRELAMQTLKFTKELGRFTGLKPILVLGGEKMEDQFSAIHENPDIIIATPGRFLHLVIEMDLKLTSVEYVVFDEADRLFEMGFQEQIEEVLHRLPEHRQTLMFSATLPKILLDFVKAGLHDPALIRLDVEHKLSENLKTIYLCCRSTDKPAILLHLLKNNINLSDELTVVFLATRHHIEYVREILMKASIPCSYIYSSLDQAARKIHVAKFRSKKVGVLLVTDIAARGIDIPLLDNVINYNFPSKPKLFVHRVGRVARAGRSGTAYSIIGPDEVPYLIDLHLFLGKPIAISNGSSTDQGGVCGSVPQSLIDDENDALHAYHETSVDLRNMVKVCENAYKQYVKSRPAASKESVKRVKDYPLLWDKIHPIFNAKDSVEVQRSSLLASIKNYRPNNTIFEVGTTSKSEACVIMRQKRKFHSMIDEIRSRKNDDKSKLDETEKCDISAPAASESEIQDVFAAVTIKTGEDSAKAKKAKKSRDFRDHENYLSYVSREHYTEKGLGLQSSFEQDASAAVLDLTGDDAEAKMKLKSAWHWDRKKKRFIKDDGSEKTKKIKTESGVWIPKSYKSDLYKKWQENNKIAYQQNLSGSEDEEQNKFKKPWNVAKGGKRKKHRENKSAHPAKREMKTKEEILKARKRKARLLAHQKRRHAQRGRKKGPANKHKK